jgi:hypothetical protein
MLFLLASLAHCDALSMLLEKPQSKGLITLTGAELIQAVYTPPRDYDLVVFLYRKSPGRFEKELIGEFKDVAELYSHHKFDPPVFFALAETGPEVQPLLTKLKISYFPVLLVSKPAMANPAMASFNDLRNLKTFFWQITNRNGHVTADKLTEYINARTGRDVRF